MNCHHPDYTVIIPARMASTRLPNKPLADIGGIPMVVRVALRAQQSRAQRIVVAADDPRIVAACTSHGIDAMLTRQDHLSGSDRLAQACEQLQLADDAIVVNVQGDEPLIDPQLIDATARELAQTPQASMATAAHPIDTWADYQNPNIVKVVLNGASHAQYFSRSPIPHARDHANDAWWHASTTAIHAAAPLRHIGIYSYRAQFLRLFPTLAPAPTETLESLEQLRALWHGHTIAVHITETIPFAGVDTPEDLERVRQLIATAT